MVRKNPDPSFAEAVAAHQRGDLTTAREMYERCLARNPKHPYALINLGSVYRHLGDANKAIDYLRRAVLLVPKDHTARYNLGNALLDVGKNAAAVASYRAAVSLAPKDAATWYNLAIALRALNDTEGERDAYRHAIAANPGHLEARLNLAESFSAAGEVTAAEHELLALREHAPGYAPALNNIAQLQQDTGRHQESLQTLQQAMARAPDLAEARSNLLIGLQYAPDVPTTDLTARAREWGRWAMGQSKVTATPSPCAATRRALRVGYVSADLHTHPVGLFIEKVLAAHDPSAVQPVIYSNGAKIDDLARHLQQVVQQKTAPWAWREVRTLNDAALAVQIRADAIDILVDLSGHTGNSRLAAFAWKPAPVQVSWLGYFATTGLPTMDFVILDPWHAPPGTEAQFSERIIRLPHNRFCYSPAPFAPTVAPAPTLNNGYITFGSFNNTAKLNDPVLDTWAQILHSVSKSRLILKWRTFADAPYRRRITAFFVAQGVAAERIELRTMSPHRDLLREYADLDIALDPFPFSGGYTSCEALWMGVPVVTWPQDRVVSRQTWSFLNNTGLPGLAAFDREGYVRLAITLAKSPKTIRDLRHTLRDRMRASPLCDVVGFTRQLEEAYRVAWQAVMGSRPTPSTPPIA